MACKVTVNRDANPVYNYKVGLEYRWLFPYAYILDVNQKQMESICKFLNLTVNVKYGIWLVNSLPFVMNVFGQLRGRAHSCRSHCYAFKKLLIKFDNFFSLLFIGNIFFIRILALVPSSEGVSKAALIASTVAFSSP